MEKMCTKCKEVKDSSEFSKDKNSKDGIYTICKDCKKGYYYNNKKEHSLFMKLYYQNNKEKINKQHKEYYNNNKKEISSRKYKYRTHNKIKINKQNKIYKEMNKEVIKARSIEYNNNFAIYKTYKDKLTVDESPRLSKDGISLEVKCRYCGKYFIPTNIEVSSRIKTIKGQMEGECSLYCSDNCKEACPVYNQKLWPKEFKPASSREVNPLVRQMCFERDNWKCQICGAIQKEAPLHCHHIEGYAQNPRLGNDVANTITLCKTCHKDVHKLPGCGYYGLRCVKDQIFT